jgi:fluoride exporter
MTWLLIAIGSALGGIARHATGLLFIQRAGSSFPWGTFTVNVIGSLAIGVCGALVEQAQRGSNSQLMREFVMIGFLGGFTTFSAFSLQTLQLLRDGKSGLALANVAFSVLVCLAAVWLGYTIAARVTAS